MPKPWEKYQTTTTGKPWEKYSQKEKSWLEADIPIVGGKVGENLVRPVLQGAGAIGGGVAGASLGPVGAVAGGGLGYAAAEELYKMLGGRESGTLGEELVKAGKNVATGAAMEAGGQALPVALSAARKVPGLAKSGIKKVLSKPRVVGSQVKDAGDILNVLKSEKDAFKPTMGTELENLKYTEEGLEPLTPTQMQPKAGGEPTPAQYTETLLKSRDKGLYDQQQRQLQKYRDILEQYQNKGSANPEIAGQKVKEGLKAGKKATGEVIGEFKQAGKDIPLGKKDKITYIEEGYGKYKGLDENKMLIPDEKTKQFSVYNIKTGKEKIFKTKEDAIKFADKIENSEFPLSNILKKYDRTGTYYADYGGKKIRVSNHPSGHEGYLTEGKGFDRSEILENNYIKHEKNGVVYYTEITDPYNIVIPSGHHIQKFKKIEKEILKNIKTADNLPIEDIDKFTLGSNYNKLLNIEDMYRQAGTVEQLDALSSNIGSQISEASRAGNNNYARKLKEIKTFLEDRVAQSIEGAGITKPKEAYEAYTAVNKLYNETLSGTTKTGASRNVIKKITSSGENIKQFKDTVKKLNTPELMTTVKENWLSELFNEATERNPGKWITKWAKYKKEGIAQNLLNKEDIKKIDLLADYYNKYTSTTTGAVNPSRTGVIGFVERVASQPVKSIVNYVLGDELKYAKALRQYKNISKSTPGITGKGQKSVLPYMVGRDKE